MLRKTPYQKKFIIWTWYSEFQLPDNLKKSKNINARTKFENGPANETIASSRKGLLKFFLLTGTGLAHPINANPVAKEAIGIITVPIRSICFKGLRVSLPCFFAVLSPRILADKAWANSWKVIEIKKTGKNVKNDISLSLI